MTPAEADGTLFDGTTHCAEALPLAWTPGAAATAGMHDRNTAMLRMLGLLDEPIAEARDDKSGHDAETPRVEAKLDLMLHVVGMLVAHQLPPPPAVGVQLSCRGLVWRDAPRSLALGDAGRLTLNLHPAIPLPLDLAASVVAVDHDASPSRAWLAFETLPEPLAAALERFTFRRHRRAIAGLRRAGSGQIPTFVQ